MDVLQAVIIAATLTLVLFAARLTIELDALEQD